MTRIHILHGAARSKPRTGDRRFTKKHGLQIRIPVIHNGLRVVSAGRQLYTWCNPGELPNRGFQYLLDALMPNTRI